MPTSPVSAVLQRGRGGLYHVCYAVEDLEAQIEKFYQAGCAVVSGPNPAVAFGGRRVAFLYTPQDDLIELVESEKQ